MSRKRRLVIIIERVTQYLLYGYRRHVICAVLFLLIITSHNRVQKEVVQGDLLQPAIDYVYECVKQDDGNVNRIRFLDELHVRGMLKDDPRMRETLKMLDKYKTVMKKEHFQRCISKNITTIESAFTNSNIIGQFKQFSSSLRDIYHTCTQNTNGKVSTFIPQYARQNPEYYGLSLCTVNGQRLNIGDSDVDFCIRSCIKPISYCMAVEEHGYETVHKYVGREPSGVSPCALKVNEVGLPHNPLIDSGAIMICALIKYMLQPAERFDFILRNWSNLAAGKSLGYSNSVYLSESGSGDRNYALAYYMKEMKVFPPNVDIHEVLQFYFQVISLTINTNYLSIVAASLANGGVCPLTGKQVFSAETVKNCLSLMYSCGMHDYSGEFAFITGLPAKSSNSGAIFVVIPNVMGICTFSPRLDKYSNSVRGVEFFRKFAKRFHFHLFDCMSCKEKEDPRRKEKIEEALIKKINKASCIGDLSLIKRLQLTTNIVCQGDYDMRTPLHIASSNGHLNVIEYLLERFGTDIVNPLDRWHGTPLDDAIREDQFDVVEYLKSAGGVRGKDL